MHATCPWQATAAGTVATLTVPSVCKYHGNGAWGGSAAVTRHYFGGGGGRGRDGIAWLLINSLLASRSYELK